MNYIFYYNGKIPNYVYKSIDSIIKVEKNPRIIFCSDTSINIKGVETVLIDEFKSDYIDQILKLNKDTKGSLWINSFLRIFYNLYVAKKLSINKFVHFDSDVVLYKNYDSIKKQLDENLFNITPLNEQLLVFGYSYVGNIQIYEKVCNTVFEVIQKQKFYEKKYLNNQNFNEMAALYITYKLIPECFNLLPVLPDDKNDYIFDPASYGQYLGGVHKKMFSKKYASDNHIVGKKINENKIEPKFDSSGPFINYKKKKVEIVNLHIHSKKLNKFMI